MSYVIAAYGVTGLWLAIYALQLARARAALRRDASDGPASG